MMKLFNNFTCFLSQSIGSQEKNVEEYHMSTIDEEPINYKNKNFLKSSLSRHSLVILSIIYVLFHQNVFTSKWNEPSVLQLVNTHSRVLYDTEPLDENLNYESKKESLNKLSTKNSTNDSIKTPKKKSNNKNTKENNKKAPQKKTNDKLRRAQ
ncbi:hypothetical protein PFMC_03556 [Plasmodium falciparum CAMP/Malaysia]|uniref:Uncharacterized protein n=1 Tax=Plasmodium falciparum (isolate Camp / Malaysia) TaxID=5835 RepID=A0A024X6X9_PLAFC|nr:hypothetical protein PFMC_03556 [Plasmodium falciparum CAMP/Malaysia]